MIHEDITISGSFKTSGSFVLPRIPSNSLATATTGSMYYDTVNDVVKIYTGTGSTSDGWVTVGAQSEPAAAGGGAGPANVEYVLIAGGGGGGTNSNSGGGGAGGYLSSSLASVASGSTFTITVGAGGGVASNSNGTDGSASSIAGSTITTITADGGGGGSKQGGSAGDGGSGGGGAYDTTGGSGTSGQGFDGGDGQASGDYPGGGGGVASEAGNTDGSGTGGDGKASSITGTSVTRAGGGSGGVSAGGTVRAAGDGGGGTGAEGNNTAPVHPVTNTGGGGAGGAADTAGLPGASGVAILAYPSGSITATGGVKTSRSDGHFVHTFKSSGTFTVGGPNFHTVPSGDYFNAVMFQGDSSNDHSIKVGFDADFVWIKDTNDSGEHSLIDVVRGSGGLLNTNNTGADDPHALHAVVESGGFNTKNNPNSAGRHYIAYAWKAGGSVSADNNDEGSITSTVSANTAGGFSIVKWTGTGAQGTIGHGLDSAPELVISKRTDSTNNWSVYHSALSLSHTSYPNWLYLNLTSAEQNSGTAGNHPFYQAPSSTLLYQNTGTSESTNVSGGTYISYCFHSVTGHQKIGSYTGNGSAGQSITTGFRPGFILIKSTVGTDNWRLYDTTRGITDGGYLEPNTTDSNNTGNAPSLTITDTGFEIASGGVTNGDNASGNLYTYWAIAN